MRTTIDKAGRVVIPAGIRERAGLEAGAELEVTLDEFGIRLERVAPGPRLVKVGRRTVARPTARRKHAPRLMWRRSSRKSGIVGRNLPRHERAPRRNSRLWPTERSGSIDHAPRRGEK